MINTASGKIDSWIAPEYRNATWDDDRDPSTARVQWPDVYKRYATVVKRLDNQVGDILQLLKDLKIDDNTLVVFTSDNGPSKESYLKEEFSPEFFRGYAGYDGIKRDLWEGGIRVPTILKWPQKISAGKKIDTPMMFSDWLATFLDIAGASAPAVSDGVSILPSVTGRGIQQPAQWYIEYFQNEKTPDYKVFESSRRGKKRAQMQAVRIGNYKGVRYDVKSHNDDFEIYNIVKDPKERKNLASGKGFENLQQQMKDRVLQLRRPDTAVERPYDRELVPSLKIPYSPSMACNFYKGVFNWVPSDKGVTPSSARSLDRLNGGFFSSSPKGLYVVTGFINAPRDGEYTFYFKSNGKSVIRAHDAVLVDADYNYNGAEKAESILLKKGVHPIKISFCPPQNGISEFSLDWSGPGFERKAFR